MNIFLNTQNQLNCDINDDSFIKTVSGLSELTNTYKNIVSSIDSINSEIISTFGDICNSLLRTKFHDSNEDLFTESNYQKVFIGEYSEKFIEIMMHLQELCQMSWHLDTYPTLELIDKGVRQNDKENFFTAFNLLHNKLRILLEKIQKNRE